MSATFKPNSAGFRQAAVSADIRAAVMAEAERAKGIAEGLAEEFKVTGEYAASFEVTSETQSLSTGYGSHEVAAGVLTNSSEHAAAVEWGNARDHRPHHTLAHTLEALHG